MSDESSAADFELQYGDRTLALPTTVGTESPSGLGIGKLLSETGSRHPRSRLRQYGGLHVGDHVHRRRRRHPALSRLSDRGARRAALVPAGGVSAHLRRAADDGAGAQLPVAHPRAHDAARGPQGVLRRLPARRAPDGRALLGGQRAVDLLPGQPRSVRRRARRDLDRAPAGQAADHRGLRVQEVDRPAVPLPGQHAGLRGELPADDVRRTGAALRGRPRHGPGARHAFPAARRPRAELLDLDRAAGGFEPRQPLRLRIRRRQRALRSAARRRQPGRAGDARVDPAGRRRRPRLRRAGQAQASPASS